MKNTLKEILEGWKNYAFPNGEIEKMAEKRLEFCVDCTYFTSKGRCRKCGCFMIAKARVKKAKCPLNYW